MTLRHAGVRAFAVLLVLGGMGCSESSPLGNSTWKDPGAATRSAAVTTTPHLTYYGGPVLPNPKIFVVFWGSGLPDTTTSGIPGFVRSLLTSRFLDPLVEYSAGSAHLGRGADADTITLSPQNASADLTDADIQAELNAQIASGGLPLADAATAYMIYFPPGIHITHGTSHSCVSGGFCGYHSALASGHPFTVLPDNGPGTGCDVGCGPLGAFDNLTTVSSHELAEAMTDPMAIYATTVAPPLAWFDSVASSLGEVADICDAQTQHIGAITGTAGGTYKVQTLWSNAGGDCFIARAEAVDFAVAVDSPSSAVATGSFMDVNITTTAVAGTAPSLTLSVEGLPDGVHAQLTPSTVTAGALSTLRLSVDANAAVLDRAPIVVRADNSPQLHTALLLLSTFHAAPPPNFDFALSIEASSHTNAVVVRGGTAHLSLSSVLVTGSAENLILSADGLPQGVHASFSRDTPMTGDTLDLLLTADDNAPPSPGAALVQVFATANSVQRTVLVYLTVLENPAVAITSPSDQAVVSGTIPITGTSQSTTHAEGAQLILSADGTMVATITPADNFQTSLDTTSLSDGPHKLGVTVTESTLSSAPSEITLQVRNHPMATGSIGCEAASGGNARWPAELVVVILGAAGRRRRARLA